MKFKSALLTGTALLGLTLSSAQAAPVYYTEEANPTNLGSSYTSEGVTLTGWSLVDNEFVSADLWAFGEYGTGICNSDDPRHGVCAWGESGADNNAGVDFFLFEFSGETQVNSIGVSSFYRPYGGFDGDYDYSYTFGTGTVDLASLNLADLTDVEVAGDSDVTNVDDIEFDITASWLLLGAANNGDTDDGFKLQYVDVAEPGSLALIALGLTGLVAARRRV